MGVGLHESTCHFVVVVVVLEDLLVDVVVVFVKCGGEFLGIVEIVSGRDAREPYGATISESRD